MAKFKVGDRVRALTEEDGKRPQGLGTVVNINTNRISVEWDQYINGHTCNGLAREGHGWCMNDDQLELVIKGGDMDQPYQRKTYKQLRDSLTVRKGALWQEACDDGDQEYVLLDSSFDKDTGSQPKIYNRALVEESKNFVEVFKVTPEFMTREELDQWGAFKAGQSRKVTKKPAAKKSSRKWTPAQRKAHGEKIKAARAKNDAARAKPRTTA